MKSKVGLLNRQCLLALIVCSVKKKLKSEKDVVIYVNCKYDLKDP